MIIDGHAHACGDFADPEILIPILDELEVDKIILCPSALEDNLIHNIPKISYTPISKIRHLMFLANKYYLKHDVPDHYFEQGNELINSLREKHPKRIIQFLWVNPNNKDTINRVRKALDNWEIKGIKLHQCLSSFSNDETGMRKLAEFAGKNNLPIFIHIYSKEEVRKLVNLARDFPKTNFIIAHFIGLEIAKKFGKDLRNLYFDISTYFIISKRRIKYAIKHFGADHVILGSDSPFGEKNLENNIKKIKRMNINEKEKKMILGSNIKKMLKL
ncbi:MAG: amidohydrolase family protein [Candidatus Heimdallarchaeota archaeon]|nr:amidohydrolase family protein [Candidatus Heimdallarchaeota archaeon]MCK4875968.1 amidohydrolase family protein [Candidatus Heimdallarchaeota archaeon]